MQNLTDCFTLNNGVQIPCIGFGTWKAADGQEAAGAVSSAIRAGYRHIDTAAAYHNEESVGRAIRESGVARDQLFVTSKLANPEHGYETTLAACDKTLRDLGLEYLDLYLIHWPNPLKFRDHWQQVNADTWRAFEELYRAGKLRAIGVSNFLPHHMKELSKTAAVAPMVNQIRFCPGEIQAETVAYCRAHNILVEAYSPLGSGEIFKVPQMLAFAEKYRKSVAQICIRWCLQMGTLPLPKSVTPERIAQNAEVFDFVLEQADLQAIAALVDCCGTTTDPDLAAF